MRNSAKPSLKKSSESDIIAERMKKNNQKGPMETYEQKFRRLELEYDLAQVRYLDNSFVRLNQVMPGYEERTGNWLVPPEDEGDDNSGAEG